MTTEIATAFIALIGIIISVLASVLINKRHVTTELQRLKTEIQQTYAGKLLEKRIEVYPALYKLLSNFDKATRYDTISTILIRELLTHIKEWDSDNAIFMSGHAVKIYHDFRQWLDGLAKLSNDDFLKEWDTPEKHRALRREANKVELALKGDIGIYVVGDPKTKIDYYDKNKEGQETK
jgi:hypothetical protein